MEIDNNKKNTGLIKTTVLIITVFPKKENNISKKKMDSRTFLSRKAKTREGNGGFHFKISHTESNIGQEALFLW